MSVVCRKDVALQAVPVPPEQHHRPGCHPVCFQCMQFVLTPSFAEYSPLHGLTVRTESSFAVYALQSPLLQCLGGAKLSLCVASLSLCHGSTSLSASMRPPLLGELTVFQWKFSCPLFGPFMKHLDGLNGSSCMSCTSVDHPKSNQIKSNQIKSNQIKSNQIKPNLVKSNQIKSNEVK